MALGIDPDRQILFTPTGVSPEISSLVDIMSSNILLVIDIQHNITQHPTRAVPSAQLLLKNVAHILDLARAAKATVIHIRHNEEGDIDFAPNSAGWELVNQPLSSADGGSEPVVDKWYSSAFEGTNLHELVPAGSDVKLVLVGLQSDCCIQATGIAALKRGNKVSIVHGSHTTYDESTQGIKDGKTAEEIEREIEGTLEKAGATIVDMKEVVF